MVFAGIRAPENILVSVVCGGKANRGGHARVSRLFFWFARRDLANRWPLAFCARSAMAAEFKNL